MYKKLKYTTTILTCAYSFHVMVSCNQATQQNQSQSANMETHHHGEFVSMFSDNSLAGWEGDTTIWRMENDVLIGEIKADGEPLKNNTFLIWQSGQPGDFELKASFRVSASGNSGVNYRSERFDGVPYALKGYQADIDGQNNYTGQNYEERNRTTLAYRGQVVEIPSTGTGESKHNAWSNVNVLDSIGAKDELKAKIKAEDWNEIHIVAKGTKLEHYINGQLMSSVDDKDPVHQRLSGYLGLQVHVGPPMKVEYKNMVIKML